MLVAAPAVPVPSVAPADTDDAAPQSTAAAASTGTTADFKSLAAVLGIESCTAAAVVEAISALKGTAAAAAQQEKAAAAERVQQLTTANTELEEKAAANLHTVLSELDETLLDKVSGTC